jgi:hypothetical protein
MVPLWLANRVMPPELQSHIPLGGIGPPCRGQERPGSSYNRCSLYATPVVDAFAGASTNGHCGVGHMSLQAKFVKDFR